MVSTKTLASNLAPLAWPTTRLLVQVSCSSTTHQVVRAMQNSPATRRVMQAFAYIGREAVAAMVTQAAEQAVYYRPTPRPYYSEGPAMAFGRASRDSDLKDLQNITRNLRHTTDEIVEEEEELRAAEEAQRRFDALPEFVIREVREVTVKARTEAEAIEIAKIAFKHGQDEDNRIDRDRLSSDRIRGNTISKIRRVAVKVSKYLD